MPDGLYFSTLSDLVQSGKVEEKAIDKSVMRILTSMARVGLHENDNSNNITKNVKSAAHHHISYTILGITSSHKSNKKFTWELKLKIWFKIRAIRYLLIITYTSRSMGASPLPQPLSTNAKIFVGIMLTVTFSPFMDQDVIYIRLMGKSDPL